jgi:hypothetical protein
MVKMSVDFASEAPRCQRISSITAQITFGWATKVDAIIGFFSMERPAAKLCALRALRDSELNAAG